MQVKVLQKTRKILVTEESSSSPSLLNSNQSVIKKKRTYLTKENLFETRTFGN